jgi:hypothetical protein
MSVENAMHADLSRQMKKTTNQHARIPHRQSWDTLLGCPSFANMRDACVLICCFFSFGGKDQHAWHFLTCGHVRISAQNSHVIGLVQNIM